MKFNFKAGILGVLVVACFLAMSWVFGFAIDYAAHRFTLEQTAVGMGILSILGIFVIVAVTYPVDDLSANTPHPLAPGARFRMRVFIPDYHLFPGDLVTVRGISIQDQNVVIFEGFEEINDVGIAIPLENWQKYLEPHKPSALQHEGSRTRASEPGPHLRIGK